MVLGLNDPSILNINVAISIFCYLDWIIGICIVLVLHLKTIPFHWNQKKRYLQQSPGAHWFLRNTSNMVHYTFTMSWNSNHANTYFILLVCNVLISLIYCDDLCSAVQLLLFIMMAYLQSMVWSWPQYLFYDSIKKRLGHVFLCLKSNDGMTSLLNALEYYNEQILVPCAMLF